jgi:predicted translin family RNA/ssDNA-binding protein
MGVCRYLAGVLDFAGELNRWAVGRATARDVAAVQRARSVVDSLQGQFLQMDLRNGALR